MNHTATFLLFLGALPLLVASSKFELDHQFSSTVKPCQDFYKYVCNPDVNGRKSFSYQLQHNFANKITSLALNYSDPVIDFLREVYLRDLKNEALFKEGRKFGEESASGYQRFVITPNVRKETFQIVDQQTVGRGKVSKSVECVYKNCPAFVKGIVSGYKQLVDDDNLIDLKKWKIVAKYMEVKAPEVTEKQRSDITARVFQTPKMEPYLNVLMTKFASENSLWISKEMEEELMHVGDVLIEEVVALIQNQTWIPEDRKKKTIENIRSINKFLVLFEATKDLENIEKVLSYYVAEFQKKNGNILAQMKNESCGLKCILTPTGEVIHHIMNSYNLKFGLSDKFVDFLTHENSQRGLFTFNAFTVYDRMMIHPALQFYMKETLPVGLRWSTVAMVLGHEIFHSLDPLTDIVTKASEYLFGLQEYDQAAKCYEDYYGSFEAIAPNGTIFKPNGTVKVGEGFADVEGARAMLRVLQKTVFSDRGFKSSFSYSTYNDLEWFFLGAQLVNCGGWKIDDFELFKITKDSPHPRHTVRANAWVRQLDEFSRVFGCKPGDPMYVVEKQCKAFPLIE